MRTAPKEGGEQMTIAESNGVVPRNIERLITDSGFKKGYVAEKAGLSSGILSDMLNNRRLIRVADIVAISNALGVEINELLKE
jgi:transcriptional regulator with XRE-family HTH domain